MEHPETLTTSTFHLLPTGAFGVNMIVRSRSDTGVFSHSSDAISCWACALRHVSVPGQSSRSSAAHFLPAAIIDPADVSDLGAYFWKLLFEF